MNVKKKQAKRPKYTIREIGANLNGGDSEVTAYSDISSEAFPFSEDDYDFFEQDEYIDLGRNEP